MKEAPSVEIAEPKRTRVDTIDGARALMVLMVITLHATPMLLPGRMPAASPPIWAFVLATLCRCAVPFFFLASGYFLNLDRTTREIALRSIKRLGPIYAFWLAIYAAIRFAFYNEVPELSVSFFLNGGAAFHLWFLPALFAGQVFVSFFVSRFGYRLAVLGAALLYFIGPILYDYHDLFGLAYYWRIAPIYRHLGAPAFVLLGLMAHRFPEKGPLVGLFLVVTSFGLLVFEELMLGISLGHPGRESHDFLLSTLLYSTSVFLLLKSLASLSRIAWLGQMTLGIYAVHLAFIWLIRGWISTTTFPGEIAVVTLVSLGSTVLVLAMRRISFFSRFVA